MDESSLLFYLCIYEGTIIFQYKNISNVTMTMTMTQKLNISEIATYVAGYMTISHLFNNLSKPNL